MNLWLQLGLGGAALFLLYFFIKELFKYLNTRAVSDSKGINKLVDKIDNLIESNHAMVRAMGEALIKNQNGSDTISNMLNLHFEMLIDMQKKVARIDDRTYKCLGNGKEKEDGCKHNPTVSET